MGSRGPIVSGPQVGPFDDGSQASTCPACGGRGVRRGSAFVDVSVPRGAKNNTKLRLKGLGGPGRPPGDLFVDIDVKLPETAQLRGRDVFDTVTVTPMLATSGGELDYEGLSVRVPANVKPGGTLRSKGMGVGGGDLVLKLEIDLLDGLRRSVSRSIGRFLRKLT